MGQQQQVNNKQQKGAPGSLEWWIIDLAGNFMKIVQKVWDYDWRGFTQKSFKRYKWKYKLI